MPKYIPQPAPEANRLLFLRSNSHRNLRLQIRTLPPSKIVFSIFCYTIPPPFLISVVIVLRCASPKAPFLPTLLRIQFLFSCSVAIVPHYACKKPPLPPAIATHSRFCHAFRCNLTPVRFQRQISSSSFATDSRLFSAFGSNFSLLHFQRRVSFLLLLRILDFL